MSVNFSVRKDFSGTTITTSAASQLPRRSLSTEPLRPAGFMLYNIDDDTVYVSDGLQWVDIPSSSGGLTLSAFRSDHANNIFDNWDDLMSKLQNIARPVKVYVEGSFSESVTISSGTFDLLGVRFKGAAYPDSSGNIANKSVLRVGPQSVLVNANYFNSMILLFQSTSPSITLPYPQTPGGTQMSIINSTFSPDTGTFGPIPTVSPILVTANTNLAFTNSDINNFIAGAPPVIETAAGVSLFIDTTSTANFSSLGGGVWAIGGSGTFNFSIGADTTINPFPQDPGITIGQFPRLAYRPAVTANWSGSTTISIAGALDRIAAAIGPIP